MGRDLFPTLPSSNRSSHMFIQITRGAAVVCRVDGTAISLHLYSVLDGSMDILKADAERLLHKFVCS